MKLDIKTLTKMIKEEMSILKEKSGTGRMGGTYAGKRRQSQHDKMTAVSDFETHKDSEPEKSAERTVYDKSQWIHPYSDVTHTVGDDGQPKSGWRYRQSTTTPGKVDLSKWTHPYSKQTTTLSKGQKQPEFGWAQDTQARVGYTSPYEPSPRVKGQMRSYALDDPRKPAPTHGWTTSTGGKLGQTKYHHGSTLDYDRTLVPKGGKKSPAKAVTYDYGKPTTTYRQGSEDQYKFVKDLSDKGKGTWDGPGGRQSNLTPIKKTTNPKGPDITTYATKYGQGGPSDYSLDQTGVGRDQFTVPKLTKNPSSQETYTTDAWIDWKGKFDDLQQSVADAEAAMKDAEAKMKKTNGDKLAVKASEKPGSNMGRGGVVVGTRGSRGGAKSKGGFGSGKSAGKGKGKKGKKKDESLFRILGRDLIKEFNEIKRHSK